MKLLTIDFCVSELHSHNHLDIHSIRNCLFLLFSVTLGEQYMSLKVPKLEKFYKLLGSRAVVEFRINSGFFSPRFFGTLLVAFAKIQGV